MLRIREVVVTGERQVELREGQLDEALAPHEILIETERTFISAGTELANYMARDRGVFVPGNWCAYPWRSGYGNVGIVRAAGPEVTRARVGQRVLTYGNHASFVKYDAESRLVIQVPDGMDSALAASSRMAGVAMTAIILSEIKGAPWVVVFGLGAVGNSAAQGFAARGCRVIGVDPVAKRREVARKCGIQHTIGGTPPEVRARVKEIAGGGMAGIAVDAVGDTHVMQEAMDVVAPFGQTVILGSPRVAVEGNVTAMLADIHVRFLTVRGALEWCLPMYPGSSPSMSQYEKQVMIFDWMARGILKLEPLISHRLTPDRIKEAYEGLEGEKGTFTGVALDWTKQVTFG